MAGERGGFDIVLNHGTEDEIGLMLDRSDRKGGRGPATIEGQFGPTDAGDVSGQLTLTTKTWDSLHGGCGVSRAVEGWEKCYAWAPGMDWRQPRVGIMAGALETVNQAIDADSRTIAESAEYKGHLYAVENGRNVLKFTTGQGQPTIAFKLPVGATGHGIAVFQDMLWVGAGAAGLHRFDGTTWTSYPTILVAELATVYWVIRGVGGWRMVATIPSTAAAWVTADPSVLANWTAAVLIGDASQPIRSMASSNRAVYFCKPDGVHALDARGYAPNITPHWRHTLDLASGVSSIVWNGKVYAGHYSYLDEVDVSSGERQDQPRPVDIGSLSSNETPIHGRTTAMCPDAQWLVVATYDPVAMTSYLGWGMPREQAGVAGPGPFVWHYAPVTLPDEACTHVRVTSLSGRPKMLIGSFSGDGSTSTDVHARWLDLPHSATPVQDWRDHGEFTTPMRFQTEGQTYFPIENLGEPNDRKALRVIEQSADNLQPGSRYLTLYANAEDGEWVEQGIMDTSPRGSFSPESTLTSGYELGLRLDAVGTPTQPPIIRSTTVKVKMQPDQSRTRWFNVVIGPDQPASIGNQVSRDGQLAADYLWALQAGPPVQMWLAQHGRAVTVQVEGGMQTHETELTSGAWEARVRFAITLVEAGMLWDVDSYDTNAVWG